MSNKINFVKAAASYDQYMKLADKPKEQSEWMSKKWIHVDLTVSSQWKITRFFENVCFIRFLHRKIMGINLPESCRRLGESIKKLGKPTPDNIDTLMKYNGEGVKNNAMEVPNHIFQLISVKNQIKTCALTLAFHNRITSSDHYQADDTDAINTALKDAKEWTPEAVKNALAKIDAKIAELGTVYGNNLEQAKNPLERVKEVKDIAYWESAYKKSKGRPYFGK